MPGQGPHNDPRLIERRGDLSGLNAALFVILVIVAFVAAAVLLANVLHIGGSGASPSAIAASSSPSVTVGPSGSTAPSPSRLASPSTGASAALGQPVDVVVGGHVVGTVSVISVQYPTTVAGKGAGFGFRWLAVKIRYEAKSELTYDPANWAVVDVSGNSYAWAGVDFKPALAKGTLKTGAKRTGNVTFKVPTTAALWAVFSGGTGEHRVELPAQ